MAEKAKKTSALKEIWYGHEGKFTCVPNEFLERAAKWRLKPIQVVLVMHLLKHKWTREHPYPSVKTLMKGTGRTRRVVQNALAELEVEFKLLKRIERHKADGDNDSNAYDLRPLFEKLAPEAPKASGAVEDGQGATPPVPSDESPCDRVAEPGEAEAEAVPAEVAPDSGTYAEPVHAFKLKVREALSGAIRWLRQMGEYSPEREDWIWSQDLDSAVKEAAGGRPINKKVVVDVLRQLVERAIEVHPRRAESGRAVAEFGTSTTPPPTVPARSLALVPAALGYTDFSNT